MLINCQGICPVVIFAHVRRAGGKPSLMVVVMVPLLNWIVARYGTAADHLQILQLCSMLSTRSISDKAMEFKTYLAYQDEVAKKIPFSYKLGKVTGTHSL